MPIIHIHLMQGRSQAQKNALAKAITKAAVDTLGAKPDSVRILINELGFEDFFVAGETLSQRKQRQSETQTEAT